MMGSVHIADVLVGLARQDQRYVGLSDAEQFSYIGLGHGPAEFPNPDYFFGGEKLLKESNPASVNGMLPVGAVVHPFKVGGEAVNLHAINVIDHRKVGRVGDECECDKSVNIDGFYPPINAQVDLRVSHLVDARSENFSIAPLRAMKPHASSVETSYTAEVADLVTFTEFGDGDTPPFFDEHNMGPCARSAHIIASFCAHQGE